MLGSRLSVHIVLILIMLSLTIFMLYSHVSVITRCRLQSKKSILSTNVDKKLLETDFLIAICRPFGNKKTVPSDFDPRLSIVKSIFDCRLSGVVMLFSAC